MKRFLLGLSLLALVLGCKAVPMLPRFRDPPPPPVSAACEYHLDGWEWSNARRLLVLPLRNEAAYTHTGEEIGTALGAELQRLGRFEVVAATPEQMARLTAGGLRNGVFDEDALAEIARESHADAVIRGTIALYSPYPRPRIGVALEAVAPQDGRVVASVEGLWDTADAALAEKIRASHRRPFRLLPPRMRNPALANDYSFAAELTRDSPAHFQRYVCRELARALVGASEPASARRCGQGPPSDMVPVQHPPTPLLE